MSINNQITTYKKVVAIWIGILFFGFLFGALLSVSTWFIIPFFAVVGTGSYFLNRVTCPNCGANMTYETSALGVRVPLLFMSNKCKRCGWDLKANP